MNKEHSNWKINQLEIFKFYKNNNIDLLLIVDRINYVTSILRRQRLLKNSYNYLKNNDYSIKNSQ